MGGGQLAAAPGQGQACAGQGEREGRQGPGAAWARIFAIVLVVLNMLDSLAFMSAYPLWSIIALVIDGLVLYALTMHGAETRPD